MSSNSNSLSIYVPELTDASQAFATDVQTSFRPKSALQTAKKLHCNPAGKNAEQSMYIIEGTGHHRSHVLKYRMQVHGCMHDELTRKTMHTSWHECFRGGLARKAISWSRACKNSLRKAKG